MAAAAPSRTPAARLRCRKPWASRWRKSWPRRMPPGSWPSARRPPRAMPDAVVITRPRQQAEPLARAVAALGRTPLILPLLDISPLPDDTALKAALARLRDYALVAFVSPNAVDAAFAHIHAWPAAVALAVVGEGSRAALARHGIAGDGYRVYLPPDPAHSDSEHLLQALDLAALAGRKVLVVRGETGREVLPDALRAAGVDVDTVAAYRRAVPGLTPDLAASLRALLAGPNDWIITSSEALRGLAGLVEQLDDGASVANLQRQRLIVPHARIAETAAALGFTAVTLTGKTKHGRAGRSAGRLCDTGARGPGRAPRSRRSEGGRIAAEAAERRHPRARRPARAPGVVHAQPLQQAARGRRAHAAKGQCVERRDGADGARDPGNVQGIAGQGGRAGKPPERGAEPAGRARADVPGYLEEPRRVGPVRDRAGAVHRQPAAAAGRQRAGRADRAAERGPLAVAFRQAAIHHDPPRHRARHREAEGAAVRRPARHGAAPRQRHRADRQPAALVRRKAGRADRAVARECGQHGGRRQGRSAGRAHAGPARGGHVAQLEPRDVGRHPPVDPRAHGRQSGRPDAVAERIVFRAREPETAPAERAPGAAVAQRGHVPGRPEHGTAAAREVFRHEGTLHAGGAGAAAPGAGQQRHDRRPRFVGDRPDGRGDRHRRDRALQSRQRRVFLSAAPDRPVAEPVRRAGVPAVPRAVRARARRPRDARDAGTRGPVPLPQARARSEPRPARGAESPVRGPLRPRRKGRHARRRPARECRPRRADRRPGRAPHARTGAARRLARGHRAGPVAEDGAPDDGHGTARRRPQAGRRAGSRRGTERERPAPHPRAAVGDEGQPAGAQLARSAAPRAHPGQAQRAASGAVRAPARDGLRRAAVRRRPRRRIDPPRVEHGAGRRPRETLYRGPRRHRAERARPARRSPRHRRGRAEGRLGRTHRARVPRSGRSGRLRRLARPNRELRDVAARPSERSGAGTDARFPVPAPEAVGQGPALPGAGAVRRHRTADGARSPPEAGAAARGAGPARGSRPPLPAVRARDGAVNGPALRSGQGIRRDLRRPLHGYRHALPVQLRLRAEHDRRRRRPVRRAGDHPVPADPGRRRALPRAGRAEDDGRSRRRLESPGRAGRKNPAGLRAPAKGRRRPGADPAPDPALLRALQGPGKRQVGQGRRLGRPGRGQGRDRCRREELRSQGRINPSRGFHAALPDARAATFGCAALCRYCGTLTTRCRAAAVRHARARRQRRRRVHQDAARAVRAREARRIESQAGDDARLRARTALQRGLQGDAVGLRDAHGRDRDGGVVAAHAGDVARLVVRDDHPQRAGRLHVACLGDEVARAAVDEGDVAAHGQAVQRVQRVAREARAGGLVDDGHQLAGDGRIRQRRAERCIADGVIARGRAGGGAADAQVRHRVEHLRHGGRHDGAVPRQPAPRHGRCGPFGVRHVHPQLAGAVVEQVVIPDRWDALDLGARLVVREGLEAEAVREFVQQDRHEVDLVAEVVVEPQIEAGAGQAVGEQAEARIEAGDDVRLARRGDVLARQLAGQRAWIPRGRARRVREVGPDLVGAGRAEDGARRRAGQRHE
ncbi:hypothetical protein Lal_00014829 [Lupinus albus]|nr:hypothetical protein Lal_00014829 [Lupinus albus]